MIKCELGKTELKDNRGVLIGELACIMRGMVKENIISKDKLNELVNDATISDEELRKQFVEKFEKELESLKLMNETLDKIKKLREKLESGDCDCSTCEFKNECDHAKESAEKDESAEEFFNKLFSDLFKKD